jgi:hypothetical protein
MAKYGNNKFQARVKPGFWKSSGGEIINMFDMDERYLNNCLRLCVRYENWSKVQDIRAHLAAREQTYDQGDWK